MANPIAEAFVQIRPDLSVFGPQLQAGVNQALQTLKLPTNVQQQVGTQIFGPGFQQQVTRSTTQGLGQTKIPVAAQRTLAQNLFGPGFRNEFGRAFQGALSGLGAGQLAAQFAFFGPGGAALAILGGALTAATFNAAKFEQSLDVLQATSGATVKQMEQLRDEAKRLGADLTLPAVTAQSAADAMTELVKAGLSVQDALAGARGVLQLATAAQISTGDAAQIVANELNAFGLAGDQAIRVADDLANAANAAQGSISDFALAMQQVAAVAHQVGFTLEDTTALLTLLAKNGLQGSDAGTSLRTSIIRLLAPTERANKLIESLGLSIRDAQGNFRPDVFAQFRAATEGLGPAARDAAAAIVFGQDAIRAVAIAGAEGARGLRLTQLEIEREGTAAQLAAARTKGLAGSFQGLISNMQTASVSIGGLAQGPVKELVDGLSRVTFELNQLAEGDFAGLAKSFNEDVADAADHAKRELTGLKDVATATNFDELKHGLAEIFKEAPAEPDRIQTLLKSLQELQDLRVESFRVGIDIGPITKDIKELRRELKEAKIDAGEIIPVTPLQKALQPLRTTLQLAVQTRKALVEQEKDTGDVDAIIASLQARIKIKIQAARADIASLPKLTAAQIRTDINTVLTTIEADPTGAFADKLLRQLSGLITKLKDRGKLDAEGGREIGKRLMDAFGEGITAEEQVAIDAARRALERTRAEGTRQIQDAIREARGNIESLATSLGQDIDKIFEASPISEQVRRQFQLVSGTRLRLNLSEAQRQLRDAQAQIGDLGKLTPEQRQQQERVLEPLRGAVAKAQGELRRFTTHDAILTIEDLKKALDDLQESVTRRQLRFDLTGAKQDFADAKAAISGVGKLTPEQKKAQQEFLAPFREKVLDAKASLQEFKLQGAIDEQQRLEDQAKKTAEEGIQKLVAAFEDGKISAQDLNAALRHQLVPAFAILDSKAGRDLGLVISRDFMRDLNTLVSQAEALSGFVGRAGTTPGPQVTRPAETVAQVQTQIRDATRDLSKAVSDATAVDKKASDTTITILRRIARALEGKAGKG